MRAFPRKCTHFQKNKFSDIGLASSKGLFFERPNEIQHIYNPGDALKGPTPEEFTKWMKEHEKYTVIRFHSLYGNVVDNTEFLIFNYKITKLH